MKTIVTAYIARLSLLMSAERAKTTSMSSTFGKPNYTYVNPKPVRPVGFLFQFKDGTRFRGKIYNGAGSFTEGINETGPILQTLDNKIYIHHYPTRNLKQSRHPITGWIDNGDGTYSEPPVEIPSPPTYGHPHTIDPNPMFLPSCIPSRISFMQFNRRTLDDLYNYYSIRAKQDILSGNTFSRNKDIAWAIHKAKFARTKTTSRNTPRKSYAWRAKVFKEFRGNQYVKWGGR